MREKEREQEKKREKKGKERSCIEKEKENSIIKEKGKKRGNKRMGIEGRGNKLYKKEKINRKRKWK